MSSSSPHRFSSDLSSHDSSSPPHTSSSRCTVEESSSSSSSHVSGRDGHRVDTSRHESLLLSTRRRRSLSPALSSSVGRLGDEREMEVDEHDSIRSDAAGSGDSDPVRKRRKTVMVVVASEQEPRREDVRIVMLPVEILAHAFHFLTLAETRAISLACRQFHYTLQHPVYWSMFTKLDMRLLDVPCTFESVLHLSEKMQCLERLCVDYDKLSEGPRMSISLDSSRSIEVPRSYSALSTLLRRNKELKEIKAIGDTLVSTLGFFFHEVSRFCPNLESFLHSAMRIHSAPDSDWKLFSELVNTFLEHTRGHLRVIRGMPGTDSIFQSLGFFGDSLVDLDLRVTQPIEEGSFISFARNCSNLVSLAIHCQASVRIRVQTPLCFPLLERFRMKTRSPIPIRLNLDMPRLREFFFEQTPSNSHAPPVFPFENVLSLLRNSPNLEFCSIRLFSTVASVDLRHLIGLIPSVQALCVERCVLDGEILSEMFSNMKNLHTLELLSWDPKAIQHRPVLPSEPPFLAIQQRSLSTEMFRSTSLPLHLLKNVFLDNSDLLTDEAVCLLLEKCTDLRSLSLRCCERLTDNVFRAFSSVNSSLEGLWLENVQSNSPFTTNVISSIDQAIFPNLRSVVFGFFSLDLDFFDALKDHLDYILSFHIRPVNPEHRPALRQLLLEHTSMTKLHIGTHPDYRSRFDDLSIGLSNDQREKVKILISGDEDWY